MKIVCSVFIFLFASFAAHSEEWIVINDMSLVKWQMDPSGKVWLRNLDEFDSAALPCCYNYHIDTTTAAGQSVWSVVLAKMATSKPLILGVLKKNEPGPITYLGNW